MREFDVMAAGHLCLDIIPTIPDTGAERLSDLLSPGKLVHVETPRLSTGGAVSNTGLAMRKLGCDVCFCARIGDDAFGKLTIDCLKRHGNTDGIGARTGADSSYSVVIAAPNIDRVFLHCPGSNDFFTADDLDVRMLERCRHFHFGYPTLMRSMFDDEGAELVAVFKKAKKAGMTTSCDMGLPDPASPAGRAPWRNILERTLPYVDVFLPSIEEAFYALEPEAFIGMKRRHQNAELINFLDDADYERFANALTRFGARMVSLKSGHRGWYFKTSSRERLGEMSRDEDWFDVDNWSDRELWCSALECEDIKSATGAGDSSIAGFLTAFLKGMTIERSLRTATLLGWQNLHSLDAVGGIRDWEETTKLLDDSLPTIDSKLGEKWEWNDAERVYQAVSKR